MTDPPPSALRVTEADVAAHLQIGGGAVAEAAGELAGSALWPEQIGGLYLARLAVAPPGGGRGIAKALVRRPKQRRVTMGQPRIHLSTRLALLDNRRLFAACGFVETGARGASRLCRTDLRQHGEAAGAPACRPRPRSGSPAGRRRAQA